MARKPHFNRVCIIGVGLIGGSLAMVMKDKGLADTVVGVGRGLANLEIAEERGIIDTFTRDVAEGVMDADLVVVATPVRKMADTLRTAAPNLKAGCVVTDVGSVKGRVVEEVEPVIPEGVHFVPGHPIAGTENSGAGAAFPELYCERACILTPTENTDKSALDTVKALWEEAGSRVIIMDTATHDKVLAAVSHLPHVIAYSLVNTVADLEEGGVETLWYSAGGFKDFTRIASSSPEMWTDICALNREQILEMIDLFQSRLDEIRRHIEGSDLEGLKNDFSRAKRIRDSLIRPDKS